MVASIATMAIEAITAPMTRGRTVLLFCDMRAGRHIARRAYETTMRANGPCSKNEDAAATPRLADSLQPKQCRR